MNTQNNNEGFKIEAGSKEELDQILNRLGYHKFDDSTYNGSNPNQPIVNVTVNPVISASSTHSETNSIKDIIGLLSAMSPIRR